MAQHWIILGIFVFLSGQFGFVTTQSTNVCKTFGSGVMQTFNTTMFHVKTTCPVTLTHFSHAGVDCFISVQRDSNGLIKTVEVLVNKIATIIQNGILTVEGNRVSLPYDHTYQKLYAFGIYTRLTSKVLPLSVTWYSLPEGVTSLWVELDRPLVDGMSGICGGINSSETQAQLLDRNVIRNGICLTGDSQPVDDKICSDFKSNARECLGIRLLTFDHLCKLNMYPNVHESAKCSFCEEFMHSCNYSYTQLSKLRNIISCKEHHCPGDLQYKDQGAAFPPTCSNPQLQTELHTATCLPPNGLVLNDRVEGYHCVRVEDCPCVHRGRIYIPGEQRSTKCQTCQCINGKWICSANTCATPCIIEGWFVTTFDGKQYSLPGTCTYVAARGLNWTITIRYSAMTLDEIYLDVYQERYIFSLKSVQLRGNEITATDLSQTEYVTVYWQSSMFVMVKTFFEMKMQVQVSPVVQMYLYLPQNVTTTGLCGSNNNNTEDDFTTSSGIVENSAEPFALSWTLGDCTANHPPACIHIDKEIFAEDRCNELKNTSGVFAQCHEYVPVNSYFDACVQRTCQATSGLEERVCVGLGNYAKACASQGIIIGDWRAETGCIPSCESNLRFDYTMQACNHTCRSLSAPDLTCDISDDPVEGCGCLHGTHLNTPLRCSPRALCHCNYLGGTTPPGPVVIDGHQCMCENGILNCSDVCDCPHGQICVHCAQEPVNTVQKTCESLSKPSSTDESCISGCYCPEGQYADHRGNCVTPENCTCEFSRMVYASGETVESNCKTCTCRGGHWDCIGDPCPGVCEVFGNGQYKTFDSKWYRFDGHCQYTLVEDIHGLFSISVESVPCCDEALTCSRAISVKLKDEVTLILRDMNVTQKLLNGWRFRAQSLYSVHTVGLYIIISVPELGLTVIWDKQTKVKIELLASWSGKVHGLCGDFDGKLINDLMTSSSTVVFSTLEFGNSWKTAVPPCSDVTQELFPCERHTYCAAWAERRCMIILSDTFKACHLKVDPASYYQACIMESCSCDFEGKFLGFCTAVAAYAGACTAQNVCIKWRTPDLCPVYCDYYNEEGQYSWHYEACPQQIKTCGKNNKFSGKLEGCYPQCPTDMPYYDENRRICTSLDQCTCYFNNTVVGPGAKVTTAFECCECIGGQLICTLCITPTTTVTSKATSVPNTTATTKASTPEITTKEYKTTPTSPIATSTTETPVTTRTTSSISEETLSTSLLTTTTEITPEESTLTTPITTTSNVTETTVTTTTSTPEITTEEHKTTTTTPITTTVTSKATSIPNTTLPISTTTTSIPSTTFDIRIGPPLTSITKQQEFKNTTTPEITITKTTKESTTTTPITTTTAETIITTTTSTPEITTEHDITTTSTVTTERPSTTSTEITSVSETTTPLTPVSTRTPVMTTTTTTVITPEESVATTLLIRSSATTETPITTSTTEITTEKPTGTIVTTIPKSSSVIKTTTLTSVTTPEITPEESTFTTPLTATSAVIETTVTTTTSTPEITPEESTFTTSLTGTSAVTETTATTTTSTPKTTSKEHKTTTTTPITTITTKTPVTTRTTSITSKESPSTTLLTTTSEITPEKSTFTTPLTTTSAVTTTLLTSEITPEESTFTTSLTGTSAVTETTVTTTTSTPEITTEEHKTTTTTPITTIITEITETSVTTSEPPLTTTEATGTTLTSKITTVSKPTTRITATTTESPITTTTTSTQKITTKGIVTPVTTIAPPVNRTTILTPETTTPHNPTCRDLIRNQTWPEGYEWMEDCFTKICRNSVIELRPLTCPTPVIPVCPRGMPQLVKDKQGCCDTWQCDCQCDVFGDPHYTTFAGQDFVFLENCTYVLVEERTPQYHLRISVDNYDCETSASCAKGIIVQYQNNTVTLEVLEVPNGIPIIKATLNQATIKAPYQAYGFRFESTDAEVYVYIKDIRSYIFLSVWNTLQINLAMEYFFNNTQGQCGVCGGASCIRRNGLVESDNCCHKTAYEWIEDDPLKPYCQQARQHVPCFDNVLTTTISPSKTTPFCTAPLCDLLRHQVFSACSGDIDVERLVSSCKFDYCISQNNASVCSPLERLADHCKKMGICVAWRNLTGGICDIACPTGMIFDECRSTPNDFCRGSERVPGRVLDTVMSGCFCPENQLLSEAHKKICVSECTNCKGPLGEPMPVGAIWESNCHMCTCNNQTRTEECWPKLPLPPPTCSRGFALTSDCCNNQICVEKTCEYSGKIYKVGEMWRDPKNPCLTYHCTAEGTKIEQTMCPQQICPEELRIWDDHNCCYSCNTTCGVILSRMTLENCTQEVMLPTCEGNCAPSSLWVRSGNSLQLEHNQFCCRERAYEMRQISLLCSGTTATQYTYKHITSCECQREV